MTEGAEGPQPPQIEHGSIPAQEQDSGWSEHAAALAGMGKAEVQTEKPAQEPKVEQSGDERLDSARKEFGENVNQLTQNLAELGNSGIEPEQGGKATQEKWAKLKEFFASDAGKNLTFANGVWATAFAATAGINYLLHGQVSTDTLIAGVGGMTLLGATEGLYMARAMKEEIKESAKKGWGKMKKLTGGGSQEIKPK